MRPMSPKNQKQAAKPGLGARLGELESLVAELEDGELDLEAAIERYQAGIGLLQACHETLGAYRARIEELSEEAGVTLAALQDPDLPGADEA